MRAVLERYLKGRFRIFSSRPPLEELQVYERFLARVPDCELEVALERCLGECKFFPVPAEILERVPNRDYVVTTTSSDCPLCGGCGIKVVDFEDQRIGVICDCRRSKAYGASQAKRGDHEKSSD